MAVNKVMDSVGNVLIDLTSDTVTPDKVLQGYTFHDKSGNTQTGTLQTTHSGVVEDYEEDNVVRFIDYDGTIVAAYSITEANALTELPVPPTHTDVDFLVFDGWNHTLEEVQTTTHSLLVGALYDTVDHKAYLKLNVNTLNSVSFYASNTTSVVLSEVSIDWGDGNTETLNISGANGGARKTHTYAQRGVYWVKIDIVSGALSNGYFETANISTYYVTEQYIGNNANGVSQTGTWANAISRVTYGKDITTVKGWSYNANLLTLILPRGCALPQDQFLWQCDKLKYISFPRTVSGNYSVSNSGINSNYSFENLIFPENCNISGSNNVQTPYNLKYFYLDGTVSFGQFNICSKYIKHINIPNSTYDGYSLAINSAVSLQELNIPSSVRNFTLGPVGCKNIFVPNTVTYISLGAAGGNNIYLGTRLETLDLTTFETPPTLASSTMSGIFKIKVMPGTLSLYQNATNWSTLYSYGLIEEATS